MISQIAHSIFILGNRGRSTGLISTPTLPNGASVDPQKLARIPAQAHTGLQQVLQREYQGVSQAQEAQPVLSMEQQQGMFSDKELSIFNRNQIS